MKRHILVAPAHYLFSDKVKSEPAWSFALVKHIGPKVESMDVLSGVKDVTTELSEKIKSYSLFPLRSTVLIVEFIRRMLFYPLITLQAVWMMTQKKYAIVHHMLPLSFATFNPLVFVVKIFFPKTKVVLGPLQLPQVQSDEQDLNVVYLGKQEYSFMSKVVYYMTRAITALVTPLAAKMFETADLVVCNSKTSLDHYRPKFPNAKFHVIYTGMDALAAPPKRVVKKDKKIRIMCAGLFSKRKGQIYLLEAMVELVKKHPNIELTLIGGGDQDSVYREFVAKNKLGKYVVFTGQISYSEYLAAYNDKDIFCLPTLSDTSPYVILEAMTFGLPIVATDIGSIKEMVGGAGKIVKPGDASALASAISGMVDDAKLMDKMRDTGISRVKKNFTWDVISKQWLGVYDKLASS